jgi:CheY-like chemotaxis protein/two-component sensor histidine kinase
MIEKATGKAADLIRRLLGYSRQSKRPTGLVDANQICEEVARLLKPSFNGSIKTNLELDPEVWPLIGDANQIEQAVMNLCLNAKDALSKSGTVSIKTENQRIGRKHPGYKSVKPGIYTVISVTDDGPGIPRNLRRKIFEPFFTTKLSGKGTGLGLTMVKMIADNHGGKLKLRSQKSKGTTFSLMLRAAPKTQQSMDLVQKSKRGGKEGVLVVDDEPSILDMGAKILTDSGYHVFTASTIADAEQTLLRHMEDIDLAILDIIFPENNGIQCCHALKELSPKLKVMLFSGYPQETCPVPASEIKQYPFIQKPFRASELLDTVRRTLDHNP